MRVLFLDHARTVISGAQFRLLDLVESLPSHGVTPIVACDPTSPLSLRLSSLGVEQLPVLFPDLHSNGTVRRLSRNMANLPLTVGQLCRAIKKTGADAVHVNTLLPRLPGATAARLCARPVVWHVRDFVVQPRWQQLYRAVARLVRRVITVSDACRAEFPGHPRMRTIYNGLDLKRYGGQDADRAATRWELGVDGDTIVVGLVGLLTAWKGHEVFLDAARDLTVKSQRPIAFVIAGGEPDENSSRQMILERHATLLGIRNRIRFTGFRDDVPRFLSALDILVVPSLRPDPLPGSVLEAMASARPVVASRIGGIPEMIEDGNTGFLVEPGNGMALADRLAKLVDDPALRERMGKAGRAVVETKFSLDSCIRSLLEVYRGL